MSDWEKQLQAYQALGRQGDKLHDDLIGRRILKGLGFSNAAQKIYELERQVASQTQGETPLWLRAQRLFLVGIKSTPWAYLSNRWRPETLHSKLSNDAIQLIEISDDYDDIAEDVPLVYMRITDTERALAVTLWLADELKLLTPPFKVYPAKIVSKWRLVAQDIIPFVAQFGPFEFRSNT